MQGVQRGNIGAKFRKADLHVHTPGSYDYDEKDLTPKELVDHFIDEGLELVVVADHNCEGWFENLRQEAESRADTLGILPGVEITTPQGGDNQIHLVAVFPPEKANKIQGFLGRIGIDSTDPSSTQADPRIPNICDEIQKEGGLPILAHIDADAGAHKETTSGNIRDKIFDTDRVAAIEVIEPDIRDQYPEFPAVKSSDAHDPDQLGRGYTYLKLTDPTFEGLQTAFSDPASRIRFSKPEYNYNHITGVKFNGEFFKNRAIQLSPNLNCLIGGKGTGKSTIIEQIRFVFDIDPRPTRIEEDYQDLVEATVGDEGEVTVFVETHTGEEYSISRQFGESPSITRRDGSSTEMSIDTFKSNFFDLEIHSQGELLELARNTSDQLALLDSYLEFEGEKTERKKVKGDLRTNAQSLQAAQTDLDHIKSEIKEHEALKENIDLMEESGVKELLDDQDDWDTEQTELEKLETTVADTKSEIPNIEDLPELTDVNTDGLPNEQLFEDITDEISDTIDTVHTHIEKIHDKLDDSSTYLETQISEWEARKQDRQEQYGELADDIEEQTGQDIDEYFELKDKAGKLEQLKKNKEDKLAEIEELERERRQLQQRLLDARKNITRVREEGVQEINNSLNNIRIRLKSDGNRKEYRDWFDETLKGSNVRTTDKRKVTDQFDPDELFDVIRKGEVKRLVNSVNITQKAAENIVNFDQLTNQLHELQIQELHDKPIIQLKHEEDWKPLDRMSDGQKCTALLSIAMLDRKKPLIIDQPEDMLDNEYIYDEVVKMSRKIKETRQIISATHNANMPILGDAEKINVMHSNGIEGFIHERGSIDDPNVRKKAKSILEGGEEAFSRRTQKYGAIQII